MPFEVRNTNFTVFSLNHELYNLFKGASKMKLVPKSTRTFKCQNRGGELIYSFLKAASS